MTSLIQGDPYKIITSNWILCDNATSSKGIYNLNRDKKPENEPEKALQWPLMINISLLLDWHDKKATFNQSF